MAGKGEGKTYIHIVEMSEKFEVFTESWLQQDDSLKALATLWQLKIQLAQAQQLSVIATQLKELRDAFLTAAGKQ